MFFFCTLPTRPSETFSAMESAVRASAMENVANRMSAMYATPEITERFQMAQKAISSSACQVLIRQQEILNRMVVPASLMSEFQAASNLVQPALQNMNLSGFNNLVQSENFLKSALEVQKASIDFLTEMKKLDNYQQKTLGEILEELRLKKNSDAELPEDFPPEVQESFLTLEEFTKIFWKENKVFILGILSSSYPAVESFVKNDFSNIFVIIVFVYNVLGLLISCKNFGGENFGE